LQQGVAKMSCPSKAYSKKRKGFFILGASMAILSSGFLSNIRLK
jgi:hypothetical protein